VDQWDWEKVITREERTMETLHETVRQVYKALRKTEQSDMVNVRLCLEHSLPADLRLRLRADGGFEVIDKLKPPAMQGEWNKQ
jgi:asparagine synthetase A